jgi:hypothetical protein
MAERELETIFPTAQVKTAQVSPRPLLPRSQGKVSNPSPSQPPPLPVDWVVVLTSSGDQRGTHDLSKLCSKEHVFKQ